MYRPARRSKGFVRWAEVSQKPFRALLVLIEDLIRITSQVRPPQEIATKVDPEP